MNKKGKSLKYAYKRNKSFSPINQFDQKQVYKTWIIQEEMFLLAHYNMVIVRLKKVSIQLFIQYIKILQLSYSYHSHKVLPSLKMDIISFQDTSFSFLVAQQTFVNTIHYTLI